MQQEVLVGRYVLHKQVDLQMRQASRCCWQVCTAPRKLCMYCTRASTNVGIATGRQICIAHRSKMRQPHRCYWQVCIAHGSTNVGATGRHVLHMQMYGSYAQHTQIYQQIGTCVGSATGRQVCIAYVDLLTYLCIQDVDFSNWYYQ